MMYVVVVTVEIGGHDYSFVSEPMAELWVDILMREFILQEAPFRVTKALKVPAGED